MSPGPSCCARMLALNITERAAKLCVKYVWRKHWWGDVSMLARRWNRSVVGMLVLRYKIDNWIKCFLEKKQGKTRRLCRANSISLYLQFLEGLHVNCLLDQKANARLRYSRLWIRHLQCVHHRSTRKRVFTDRRVRRQDPAAHLFLRSRLDQSDFVTSYLRSATCGCFSTMYNANLFLFYSSRS